MTKNKNILEILRERNKELVAEIEKHLTVEELNEENDREDLTPFYEGLIVDLKEIMKRVIEYDDAKIDILYLDRESFNKGSAHELLNRIEERLEEVAFQ